MKRQQRREGDVYIALVIYTRVPLVCVMSVYAGSINHTSFFAVVVYFINFSLDESMPREQPTNQSHRARNSKILAFISHT